jgi:hypothetical protein
MQYDLCYFLTATFKVSFKNLQLAQWAGGGLLRVVRQVPARRKAHFSWGLYNPRSLRDPAPFYMVALYILPFIFGIA